MSKTTEAQADSVGALLRQSREQKGLTTAEVATQLRLKVSQIEQIEAEEWNPAVSATFMRGYLRAYARLLKLPEQEILQNFELQSAYLRNQARPMHSFSKKNRLDAVDNRFMLATYLLVVLLIGLFLIWFWQTHILDSQPVSVLPEYRVSEDAPAGVTTGVAQTDVADSTVNSQTEPPQLEKPQTELAPTDSALPTATATSEDSSPSAAIASPVTMSEPQTTEIVPTTTTPQQTAVTIPPAETATTQAQATTGAPAISADGKPVVGSAQLQLTFSAECWVTVQDASGKRLAYGMHSAGQSLQLTGQLPFSVTLGNATAATVQLNQTAVDLSGYRAGQVARLTLDGQP